jgi:hypothetical protein
MRLGRVCITHSYVVDLDNADMVQAAQDALYEDIMSAVKYDELGVNIKTIEAPEASVSDMYNMDDDDDEDENQDDFYGYNIDADDE